MQDLHTTKGGKSVVFRGDGEPRTIQTFLGNLNDFSATQTLEDDNFSIGGLVEQLEQTIARILKKPAAIFMPTGTLANHLAIRKHATPYGRAAVQEQSHLYNDTGDSLARLSGINLVPLGKEKPSFSLEELRKAYETSTTGRVFNPISVVSIETPVRRQHGQTVPWQELQILTEFCREHNLPVHLDGARIFMQAAVEGQTVHQYAELFDSVYISLYKYFGAPFGGVLAGESSFIDGLYHDRRMFGSGLAHSSMVAALALHGINEFEPTFHAAIEKAHLLFADLNALAHLNVDAFEHGSNIFTLTVSEDLNLEKIAQHLKAIDIFIYPEPGTQIAYLHINSTILRQTNVEITKAFIDAIELSFVP